MTILIQYATFCNYQAWRKVNYGPSALPASPRRYAVSAVVSFILLSFLLMLPFPPSDTAGSCMRRRPGGYWEDDLPYLE